MKCVDCNCAVALWYYGWKHSAGGRSKPTCGRKPTLICDEDGKVFKVMEDGKRLEEVEWR